MSAWSHERSASLGTQRDALIPLLPATFIYPDGPQVGERGLVRAFAARVGGRWILVDTGIGRGNAEIEAVFSPTIASLRPALAARGIEPGRIAAIVNTHLHFDHCGQNDLFPSTPIFVQRAEWDAAQTPGYTVDEWVSFAGARYELIDGDAEVVPGARIVATPGHTLGHQAVVLELDGALTLLAGQACYSSEEWSNAPTLVDGADSAWDRSAYRRSLEHLRRMKPATVWFAHGDAPWHAA